MNFARPSEFFSSGLLPDRQLARHHLRQVLRRRLQRRRVVGAAGDDLQVLARHVAGVAPRLRDDLLHRDPVRRVPVGPEDHVFQLLDEERRLVIQRLPHHHVHAQRLLDAARIGGPHPEQRHVDEEVRAIVQLRQPAHALHRQLDLPDPLRQRHVERAQGAGANHAIGLEAVPFLEALHRLHDRWRIESAGVDGSCGRTGEITERA